MGLTFSNSGYHLCMSLLNDNTIVYQKIPASNQVFQVLLCESCIWFSVGKTTRFSKKSLLSVIHEYFLLLMSISEDCLGAKILVV